MNIRLFEKNIYANRRLALSKKIKPGIILFLGNEESSMNYKDNWYPFRQDSNFLYYFGINVAGLAAIIDTESGDEIIFGDELTIEDIVWTGPLPSVKEMANAVGVNRTEDAGKLATYISNAIQSKRKIHITPPYRPENKIKLASLFNCNVDNLAGYVSVSLIKAIVAQRSYKEACEERNA